jgi:hypothetical protein
MSEPKIPDELMALDAELNRRGRRIERQIDPGPTALGVAIAILVLIVALILPWTGATHGWQVFAGLEPRLGVLPRLFAFTSLGFGLVVSALALATRWWARRGRARRGRARRVLVADRGPPLRSSNPPGLLDLSAGQRCLTACSAVLSHSRHCSA